MRVWREGGLVHRECLAKATEIYFTEAEAAGPCGKRLLILPKFWYWHRSGNLDAKICDVHAELAMQRRGYLSEQIKQAQREYQEIPTTDGKGNVIPRGQYPNIDWT